MKINKYIMGLLMSLPFVSSCDNHIYEDASWHSWMPGMVYCSNGEIMSYENCVSKGNTPEAVLFFVDKEGAFSGKAYAVALNDYPDKEFIDPDTTYFAQGTSADIMQFDGESNTVKLRYFQVQSPIAKSVSPKFFIPSVAEMYKLYVSKDVINSTIEKCGGMPLPLTKMSVGIGPVRSVMVPRPIERGDTACPLGVSRWLTSIAVMRHDRL